MPNSYTDFEVVNQSMEASKVKTQVRLDPSVLALVVLSVLYGKMFFSFAFGALLKG